MIVVVGLLNLHLNASLEIVEDVFLFPECAPAGCRIFEGLSVLRSSQGL